MGPVERHSFIDARRVPFSDAPANRTSVDEFHPILMASEVKLELIDGKIVPFANGTVAHSLMCERLVLLLRNAAEPGYAVFSSQVGLRCAEASTYVFPDVAYTCEPSEPDAEAIIAPRLIIEVMSPLSVERDRIDKLDTYLAIPAVEEYLIIDSRRPWAGLYRRSNRSWNYASYGRDDAIELTCVDALIPLAELYAVHPSES